ncbi:Myelin regulatory factor-like protein [Hondaea fermentalgiana]|uniref:Myelin regulatory factor-like protein n=1 Tax=Hondaea fermentalgiana TaxID=2315210 RepID=A0A2R5GP13_9STRA|nr:Myelin regulatory factor-like protein [Hondaea fermentalgiana]|eukprot:GBG31518.1 Myelin regulatory factor-like protein [Hondaea fermentalgiana]
MNLASRSSRSSKSRRLSRGLAAAAATACCLAAVAWVPTPAHAWCGRNDEGDCFIAIRTGGVPESARGHARGVKFVHEDTGVAGLEEAFGHIAAVPNEGGASSELRFAVGPNAQAKLLGSGVFQVDKLDVSGGGVSSPADAVALRVTRGGLQIVNADHASEFVMEGPSSSRAAMRVDHGAATIRATIPIALYSEATRVRVQGAVFESDSNEDADAPGADAKTRLTVGSLTATSGSATLGDAAVSTNASRLELNSAAAAWAVENSAASGFGILQGTHRVVSIAHSAPRDALVVDTEGNLGLGTRWPSVKLDVNGGVQGTSAYSSASDRRWKKDIADLARNLDRVRALRPVTFEFRHEAYPEKSFDRGTQIGFVAQEVEKIVPEVVRTDAQGMKSVQYASLVPVLVGAVQELKAELDAMRNELHALRVALHAEGTRQ